MLFLAEQIYINDFETVQYNANREQPFLFFLDISIFTAESNNEWQFYSTREKPQIHIWLFPHEYPTDANAANVVYIKTFRFQVERQGTHFTPSQHDWKDWGWVTRHTAPTLRFRTIVPILRYCCTVKRMLCNTKQLCADKNAFVRVTARLHSAPVLLQ